MTNETPTVVAPAIPWRRNLIALVVCATIVAVTFAGLGFAGLMYIVVTIDQEKQTEALYLIIGYFGGMLTAIGLLFAFFGMVKDAITAPEPDPPPPARVTEEFAKHIIDGQGQ